MARHVDNLLQMTRLEPGLVARFDLIDAAEVVGAAVARARRAFPESKISMTQPTAMPLVQSDPFYWNKPSST